jgi:hypothetical protein
MVAPWSTDCAAALIRAITASLDNAGKSVKKFKEAHVSYLPADKC